jgi:ribosomal protein S27AE
MAEKMKCPHCGVAMNHHADKLTEPTNREEAALVDPALGGIVEEHHACPDCGHNQARVQSVGAI